MVTLYIERRQSNVLRAAVQTKLIREERNAQYYFSGAGKTLSNAARFRDMKHLISRSREKREG